MARTGSQPRNLLRIDETAYVINGQCLSHTAVCQTCKQVFERETAYFAKMARNVHRRTCVPEVQVTYANTTVTLQRNPDTKDFLCVCSLHPTGHRYTCTASITKHAATSNCEWIGTTISVSFHILRSTTCSNRTL